MPALARLTTVALFAAAATITSLAQPAQRAGDRAALDAKVKAFLDQRAGTWRDLNVPASDGQLLHDLIVEHTYTRALEIGTSTGHSGIWIAWALSKTGGKLITVEVDEARHREALANFEAAGLRAFVDARLGDAHEIVPALPGPFDFVFSDADKDWYPNYFKAVFPKLTVGGCYTTHNVSEGGDAARWARASTLRCCEARRMRTPPSTSAAAASPSRTSAELEVGVTRFLPPACWSGPMDTSPAASTGGRADRGAARAHWVFAMQLIATGPTPGATSDAPLRGSTSGSTLPGARL